MLWMKYFLSPPKRRCPAPHNQVVTPPDATRYIHRPDARYESQPQLFAMRATRSSGARKNVTRSKTGRRVSGNLTEMVGAIGFEPTTYGTQNRRATRLRHAPTRSLYKLRVALERPKDHSQGQSACSGAIVGCCSASPTLIPTAFAMPPLISSTWLMPGPPSITVSSSGRAL